MDPIPVGLMDPITGEGECSGFAPGGMSGASRPRTAFFESHSRCELEKRVNDHIREFGGKVQSFTSGQKELCPGFLFMPPWRENRYYATVVHE